MTVVPRTGDEGRAATQRRRRPLHRRREQMRRRNDDYTPGGHAKPRVQPPRITVRLGIHTRPPTLNR
jgi:hypothetical protein